MQLSLLTAALAAFYAAPALSAAIERDIVEDLETRAVTPRKCGSESPPQALLDQAAALEANKGPKPQAHAPIVVNTYFHVVTSSTKAGKYSQTQLNNQVCTE